MLHAKEKWREAAAMIEVQMANPDCLKIRPIEILFGHPMRRVGAAIKQQRTRLSLQPERRRGALSVEDGSAGTEHDELHKTKRKLKNENCKVKIHKSVAPVPTLRCGAARYL